MAKRIYFDEHIEYLREIAPGQSSWEITDMFNEKFDMTATRTAICSLMSRHKINSGINTRFKEGHVPHNKGKMWDEFMSPEGQERARKTTFKKGQVPANYRPVGSERIDNKDGYTLIKVQDHGTWPERWRHKHVVMWEEVNGPVPEGHVIMFGDGDKSNISLDNLILVSRAQLARLNQYDLIQNHAALTKTALNLINLKLQAIEVSKGDKHVKR